jgi:hypothetical protein
VHCVETSTHSPTGQLELHCAVVIAEEGVNGANKAKNSSTTL